MKMNQLKKYSVLILCLSLFNITGCKNQNTADRYLKMKVKPSEQQRIENQEVLGKGNKAYKKQLEKNKEDIKENNKKALSRGKHYHLHQTKKRNRESKN